MLQKPNLSEYEAVLVRDVAKRIIGLTKHEGWPDFVKAAEALAANHVGRPVSFDGSSAIEIASKVTYASGIMACIGIAKQQQSIWDSLTPKE